MPFKKGHSGYKGRKGEKGAGFPKKEGNNSLNTHYTSIPRLKKLTRDEKYLDPDKVDYYINNDMDLRELYDE